MSARDILRRSALRPSTLIICCVVGWFVEENQYFGWNQHPQSVAELAADFGIMLLLALACVCRSIENKARS